MEGQDEIDPGPGQQSMTAVGGREEIPTVERLAALIAGADEIDTRTMAVAEAARGHLVAAAAKKAPSCRTCRHHTVFSRDVPVLHCVHPFVAPVKRDVANGFTVIETRHCDVEREDRESSSWGKAVLCGVEGRLHDPLRMPWLFSVTRALFRKMMLER